jgi:DNA mismatch repair protein MutL
MSIKELPRATSRFLSSSQVLTTPVSLVKELLDNALDAKASSIDIVIAANTIDKIEVRDNGHGITPEDLGAIGKRGYTSKLHSFDELKTLGGLSLGFRGEALASAVELGDVSIITRIEGEVVATAIRLKVHGGIESQTSISHPVGTTVCVANFFSRLPVRKQTALKDAKKTMSRIKEMLQSYALARLNVRLTLKVLKVGKSNWSFAPRANEGIREVVSQVVGRETAAQCVEIISALPIPSQVDAGASSLGDDASAVLNHCKSLETLPHSAFFIVQGFLPKPDSDFTKISGGQYVSIDSRPVSSSRGSPKKIISIYKTIISAMLVDDMSEKLKSPFIRLNIVCPAGSYDPNVEPAKDDVLFENEKVLLSLVHDWFRNVYGDRIMATIASNKTSINQDEARDTARFTNTVENLMMDGDALSAVKQGTDVSEASEMNDRDARGVNNSLLEASPDCDLTGQMGLSISPGTPDGPLAVHQPRSGFDMSEDYPDEVDLDEGGEASCDQFTAEETRNKQASYNFNQLNPWVIAKLNAPISKKKIRESTLADPAGESTSKRPPSTPLILATPCGSSISRSSPQYRDLESLERRSYENIAVLDTSQSSIEGWLQKNRELSRDNSTRLYDFPLPSPESSDRERAFAQMGNVVMDRDMSSSIRQSPPAPQAHLAPRVPRNVNRPLVSPLRDGHLAFPSATTIRVKSPISRRAQSNAGVDMVFDREAHDRVHGDERQSEVHEALDFERRKEAATRKLREELRRSQSSAEVPSAPANVNARSSPHKNRYYAAIAALESNPNYSNSERVEDKILAETCLPDDDPRAYLMRTQNSIAACSEKPSVGRKLKRAKTMLLPLETIPDRTELHDLCQVVSTNINLVRKALLSLASHDQYAKSGNQGRGLVMSTVDTQAIGNKLRTLMKGWVQVSTGKEIDVVVDLGDLQGRSVAGA